MLGKRKRETRILRRDTDHSADTQRQSHNEPAAGDIFRKYFEARFEPLPSSKSATPLSQEDDDEDDEDNGNKIGTQETRDHSDGADAEWSGILDDHVNETQIEVVDYARRDQPVEEDSISKIFQKTFMTSRPPREAQTSQQPMQLIKSKVDEELDEEKNLKHDLDLQRLLRESHLLDQTKSNPDSGEQRHRATDMRLRSLGSKDSMFTQEKMPMSHRKGIRAKVSSQDLRRRTDARENGVVLERSSKKRSIPNPRRERGVDVPVVGRFKGGTLQLSRKDVASIQGPRRNGTKKRSR